MKCLNSRYRFEWAQPEDAAELLDILEAEAFPGRISLRYTRRPDAYQSFKYEGDTVDILVCRDLQKRQIAAMAAAAVRPLYVNGQPENTVYLFGLRSRREYRGAYALLARGYACLGDYYQQQRMRFFLTTILEDNLDARQLLEKKRAFMPDYEFVQTYQVFTLRPKAAKTPPTGMQFRQAEPADADKLAGFLEQMGKRQQFFPVMSSKNLLESGVPGLGIKDFYLLLDAAGHLLAAGAAWDQRQYKQYVVAGYQGLLKWSYPLSFCFPLFGWPSLPAPGSALRFLTLSFWAVHDHQAELMDIFLGQLARLLPHAPFFLIGAAEHAPLAACLSRYPHIAYRSRLYLVNWAKHSRISGQLDPQYPLYLECGGL